MSSINEKTKEVVVNIKGPVAYQECDNCRAKYVVLKLQKTAIKYDWSDKISGRLCPYCGLHHSPSKGPLT
jgi:hypothetical protein